MPQIADSDRSAPSCAAHIRSISRKKEGATQTEQWPRTIGILRVKFLAYVRNVVILQLFKCAKIYWERQFHHFPICDLFCTLLRPKLYFEFLVTTLLRSKLYFGLFVTTLLRPKLYFDLFGQTLLRPKLHFQLYFSTNKNSSKQGGRSTEKVEIQKRSKIGK